MVRRLLAMFLLALAGIVLLPWTAASQSETDEMIIRVSFTFCIGADTCGSMFWKTSQTASGWQTEGDNIFGDLLGSWKASCVNGNYKAAFNNRTYDGTCGITRDHASVCFSVHSTRTAGVDGRMDWTQCFSLDGDKCEMQFDGQMRDAWLRSPSTLYSLTSPRTRSCVASVI